MNMSKLFDDFKKHVESLSDDDIRQSITTAEEHESEYEMIISGLERVINKETIGKER